MTTERYHYTECGLDNVYLVSGFDFVSDGREKEVVIQDLEGLHKAIGRYLLGKADLSGKEIRFLRHEMSMSQVTLADLLRVSEQAVARWEKGKTEVPKPAESIIRALYQQFVTAKPIDDVRRSLKRIADLEHAADRHDRKVLRMRKDPRWRPERINDAA